jgi:hypothetical protein
MKDDVADLFKMLFWFAVYSVLGGLLMYSINPR